IGVGLKILGIQLLMVGPGIEEEKSKADEYDNGSGIGIPPGLGRSFVFQSVKPLLQAGVFFVGNGLPDFQLGMEIFFELPVIFQKGFQQQKVLLGNLSAKISFHQRFLIHTSLSQIPLIVLSTWIFDFSIHPWSYTPKILVFRPV